MNLLAFQRIVKLGITNFWRNRWLSLAASLMLMLTLVTMGVFALLNVFINSATEGINDRIDLTVYFYENATETQIKDIQYKLVNRQDVKSVHYVTKEEALRDWEQRILNSKVKSLITKDNNPLPRSLQIKAVNPESLASIAHELNNVQYQPYIREVSYQKTKTTIDHLIRLTHFVRTLGWVVTLFLLFISLVVILNTIRLTVFTRKDEVEIMRLVGANNIFIRLPFSIEAILYGLVGGFLAYLIIIIMMTYLGPRIAAYFSDIATASSTSYFYLIEPYLVSTQHLHFFVSLITLWQLGLIQLAVGILFSVSCSMFALRRYLRV